MLYDGECRLCARSAHRFGTLLRRAGFAPAPLQSQRAAGPLTEMLVITPDGRTFGGADALMQIARRIWWAWPLFLLAQLPGVLPLLRLAYRKLAAKRHCMGGACRLTGRRMRGAWVPLLAFPAAVLTFRAEVAPWVFVSLLALAIFVGCRWLTFAMAIRAGAKPSSFRSAGYLLAWVGMDARAFLNLDAKPARPLAMEWCFAFGKTLCGAALIWMGAPLGARIHPLLCGWIGMVGIVLLLHFGFFHLLSLAWRWLGVNAAPIMRAPLLSRSLTEFWSERWNVAFHELAYWIVFRPTGRVLGATPAMFLVFLVSGLVHDLVLSLPARGGFGLPTAYFVIQGAGLLAERSRIGRQIGLGRGLRGWLFTMLVIVAPVFALFHPPFIRNVILPMLHAIGAI